MHFTFGINGREERQEILMTVTIISKKLENYEDKI
jgi:hypothetical protein